MLQGLLQIAITLAIVVMIVPFLGNYIANVFLDKPTILDSIATPLEEALYRIMGIRATAEMTGWQYIRAVLYSNLIMVIFAFLLFTFQGSLPLNPTGLTAPAWDTTLHTVMSFITNTDQQHYSGETTFSYGSQVLGLGFFMFTSAASGIAVGIAFIRGLTGRPLGNFYIDLTKSITRILLPFGIVGAIILLLGGVPETLAAPAVIQTLDGATQAIATGPVAHFEFIKELGENGGGFFGVNSIHPYENPNGFTNLIETIAMLSIPTSSIITYGIFAGNKKQGWLLFWLIFVIFVVMIGITAWGEFAGNPLVNQAVGNTLVNLEGKEVRFGWAQSALFNMASTGTMTGAVNAALDSLMPPGSFLALFNLFLQTVWGGQGTGAAYLFIYLILSVFVTGLMVGRTPEIFGRKIEKREIALASIILLIHPISILIPAAITLAFPDQLAGTGNPGFHGVSEVIYEYASAAANNGSGFAGLGNSEPAPTALWWNLSCSVVVSLGRYVPIIGLLLLADGMRQKQTVPETTGTLRTDTLLFTVVTGGVILILGALTFLPVLALGAIAEAFQLSP